MMQRASAGALAAPIRSVSFTTDNLAAVGVELVDNRRRRLRCLCCREQFSVAENAAGGFAPGWYLCPNGCNWWRPQVRER